MDTIGKFVTDCLSYLLHLLPPFLPFHRRAEPSSPVAASGGALPPYPYESRERPIPRRRRSSAAGGEPSRSAIVADTTSGHHLLTINGYSCTNVPTGQKISSRPFQLGGHRWRIDYYPNGITSAVADYVSLSLILAEDVKAAVKAKHSFCLAGEQVARLRSAPVVTYSSRGCCYFNRYSTFIRREDLLKSKNLKNDSFTVRCDIVVVHGYRAEEAYVPVPPCDLRGDLGKLLETEKGADVVFEVEGETVAAHRCMLAARSPVFAAQLFGPMKEGKADGGIVRVEDMKVEVFKALLRFAYTGLLPKIMRKEEEDATYQHLLVAADMYGMDRLKLICEEKLCQYIDAGTVATILVLAEQHHCEGLKKVCFDFLATPENLRATMASDGLQHLSASCSSLMAELMARSLEH